MKTKRLWTSAIAAAALLISGLGFAAPANAETRLVPLKDGQGFDTVLVDASKIRFEKAFGDPGTVTYYLEITNSNITNSDPNALCDSANRCPVGGSAGYALELIVNPNIGGWPGVTGAIQLYTAATGSTRPALQNPGNSLNVSYTLPLPALEPTFDTPTPTADGFTVNVTNWNSSYNWVPTLDPTVSGASVAAGNGNFQNNTLPITVTGLAAGTSATVRVTTAVQNELSVTDSATVSGTAQTGPTGSVTPNAGGTATVSWSNLVGPGQIGLCAGLPPCRYFASTPPNTPSGSVTITEGMPVIDSTIFGPPGNLPAGSYFIYLVDAGSSSMTVAQSQSAISIGSGGGGGGTGGGAPVNSDPAPTTPASPAAPVVTLAPQSVSTLPSGEAVAQVGGEPLAVTTSPVAPPAAPGVGGSGSGTGGLVPNGVTVSGGGVEMTASGPSIAGNFSGTGVSVPASGPMTLDAAGFTAGSPVAVYLIVEGQDPILLESATVNAAGELASRVQIPGNVRPGPAVVQIDGTNASNQSLSISLGIEVQDAVSPQTRASGNLPAPAPGRAVALNSEGRPLPGGSVRVGNGVVRVNADGTNAAIRTIQSAGVSAPASAGLTVGEDGFVRVSGSGFAPNSRLSVWGFSTPVLIGLVSADAEGRYNATLPIAGLLGAGKHTFQVTGIDRRDDSVSLSAGLRVLAAGSGTAAGAGSVSTTAKPAKARTRVTFARLSTTVTSSDRAALRALVNRVGVENIVSTKVTGYVQKSDDTRNDVTLSRARAKSTAAQLRSLGVKGKITLAGKGVLNSTSSKARSAVVTFTYQR